VKESPLTNPWGEGDFFLRYPSFDSDKETSAYRFIGLWFDTKESCSTQPAPLVA